MRICNTPESFTSRKVPRYLYHLTSAEGLKKIQESNAIKTSNYTLGLNFPAVFLFELKNFTKHFTSQKDWGKNNLALDLLSHCAHKDQTLTLIRIPVDKLDKSKLKIRSLNELFKTSKNSYHTMEGAPAVYAKRYKNKRKSIEYIYPQEIPFNNIEVLGNVENYKQILKNQKLKGVLLELFKGQPEENCIKTLH